MFNPVFDRIIVGIFKNFSFLHLRNFSLQITNEWLSQLVNSKLMDGLRDICLKNCKVSHEGLKKLNWKQLENINIIGVSIRGKLVKLVKFMCV